MKHRVIQISALLAVGTLASCYPYPEDPPPGHSTTAGQSLTPEEQQKIQEQRDRMREEAERKKQAEMQRESPRRESPPPPIEPTRPRDYPFATPVPGRPGLVFSPYNNKTVDVTDIPSGTLVQDPTYPPTETSKRFRVP